MGCIANQRKDNVIYIEQLPDVKLEYRRKGEYIYEFSNVSETYSTAKLTQWVVNEAPITTAFNHMVMHPFPDTGFYSIKLITGGQRCRDSIVQPLQVALFGDPSFTTPKSAYCAGEVVRYANTSAITAADVKSYAWRFGNGSQSTEASPAVAYAQAGTYTDTLAVTFIDEKVKTVARTITVNAIPRAGFGVDSLRTCGSYYTLAAQDGHAATCRWSDGSAAPTLTATHSGDYSVTLTSAQGCTATESIFVALNQPTLDEPMVMGLGSDRAVCGSALLDAQNPGSAYRWSDGSAGRTLAVTRSGAYGVRVTHSNGCTDSAGVTITVNPQPSAALGSRSILLCENSRATLAPAFVEGSTYRWSNGSAAPSISVAQAGAYSVRVSNGLCADADTVQVYALPVEAVSLGADRFLCSAEPTLFTLPAYLNVSRVAWYKDGREVSGQSSYLTNEAGAYSVQVTYPNGCRTADSVKVEHSAAGVYADFLMASVAEVGDSLHLIDLSYPNVTRRTWTFSDGFSSSEKYLYHAFYAPGDKIVTLTAANEQCTAQRSKRVSVVESIAPAESDADSAPTLQPEIPLTPEQKTAKYVEIEEVKAYPNPTSGEFYVAVTLSAATDLLIEVYSVSGALVSQRAARRVKEHTERFSISRQPGMYMVLVSAGSERKVVKVLVGDE
jgi:PKD repeat protein